MKERAVPIGLAALLTTWLGSSLAVSSLFSSPLIAWSAWLLLGLYALSVAAVIVLAGGAGFGPRRVGTRFILKAIAPAIVGAVSLGLLWSLAGKWEVPVFGGPPLILVLVVSTLRRPPPDPMEAEHGPNRGQIVAIGVTWTLLLAMIFPIVGFTGAGLRLVLYPWRLTFALLMPSLVFAFVAGEGITLVTARLEATIWNRFLIIGTILLSLVGIVLAGRWFPGGSEVRLLAIGPAAVVSSIGLGAPLHPSVETGARLARSIVIFSFLLLISGLLIPLLLL